MIDPTIEICLNCPDEDCKGTCSRVEDQKKEYWHDYYEKNKSQYKYRQQTNWEKWIAKPENKEKRRAYFAKKKKEKKESK